LGAGQEKEQKREQWGSKLGFILAASGSAIGLGNIWKFPYITGENGGAAFIIVYLFAIALVGLPVLLSEFLIGKKAQKDAIGSFKELAPGKPWYIAGYMGLASAFMILSFYGVVAGWALSYTFKAVTGQLAGVAPEQLENYFGGFITSTASPIFWQVIFMVLTILIVVGGIKKGIERWSKILMPILVFLILLVIIRSVTLPGAGAGIEFLLKPDFSKLSAASFLIALGHAFFTLSLGMGTMITYGGYLPKGTNLPSAALNVSIADTVIALLAGLAIFPAVFAFGMDAGAGPGLVFITLPAVFQQMPMGSLFATVFFALISIAALTSAISILEVPVAFFKEKFNWSRKKATWIIGGIITVVGVGASLSMGPWSGFTIAGKNFFDQLDWMSANILLPLGGLVIALFVGWGMKLKDALAAADFSENEVVGRIWVSVTKFIAPVLIMLVFLHSLGILDIIISFVKKLVG